MIDKKFKISGKTFKSRLIVGTGKYKSFNECAKAIKFSGAEIVTVAVRRVNISDKNKARLQLDVLMGMQQNFKASKNSDGNQLIRVLGDKKILPKNDRNSGSMYY